MMQNKRDNKIKIDTYWGHLFFWDNADWGYSKLILQPKMQTEANGLLLLFPFWNTRTWL